MSLEEDGGGAPCLCLPAYARTAYANERDVVCGCLYLWETPWEDLDVVSRPGRGGGGGGAH